MRCDFRIEIWLFIYFTVFILFYFADTTINDKKGEGKKKKMQAEGEFLNLTR